MKYHVCNKWDEGDLESLYIRCGRDENQAIKKYLKRWPEATVAMAVDHVHKVFLYKSLEEAMTHPKRGQVLEIDDEFLEVHEDIIEGFSFVFGSIDAEDIKVINQTS